MPTHSARPARREVARPRRRRWTAAAVVAAGLIPATLYVAAAAQGSGGPLVRDAFRRVVAGGWGNADAGGAYTVSPEGSASVRNGRGVLTLTPGATVSAVLRSVQAQDVDARVTLGTEGTPGGNGLYASLLLRRQADRSSYRVQARVRADGRVGLTLVRADAGSERALTGEVRTRLVVQPGSAVVVEGVVRGTSPVVVQGRAWAVGAKPGGWAVTASDTRPDRIASRGGVGLVTYLSTLSSPDVPVRATVGALSADVVPADAPAPEQPPTPTAGPTPSPTASPAASPAASPTAPATSPASPSSVPSAPAPARGRAADAAGAPAPGGSHYAVPAGALFVSPAGSDDGNGTAASPYRTVGRAVAAARSGATLVLRGGIYHEDVSVPASKRLTVQSFPGEAVWFDGSSRVSGWAASGSAYVHDGWNATFDSTPCYNPGSCATSDPDFQFVSSTAPMAAHPDQVFVDGVAQRQVASAGAVGPGSFAVDYAAHRLFLGTDPRGHDVVASDLSEAFTLASDGSVLRGIGVRRYATALPRMGTIRLTGRDQTLEDVTVVDNAVTGIAVTTTGARLRHVTSSRNGMLGVDVNYADGFVVEGLRAEGNNTEHFKTAPVAGGMKITRTRGVHVSGSTFARNEGTGLWMDESVYDATVTGSDMVGNAGHGVSFEISAKGLFADDLVLDNARDGFKINDSSDVTVWNSTVAGNGRTVELVQDDRQAADRSTPGHDPRQAFPDPTMTWLTGHVRIGDSVLGGPRSSANCVLCVEDHTGRRSAAQMGIAEDANLYFRSSASAPSWLVVWSSGAGNPDVFSSLEAFRRATGQAAHSAETTGSPLDADGRLARATGAEAQPLPADVAAALGRAAGERHLGAWT